MPEEALSAPLSSPSKKWRSVLSLLFIIVWVPCLIVVYGVAKLLRPSMVESLYKIFHRSCCRAFSLQYTVKGQMSSDRPTLYLANHVSYLDIFVLGSEVPGFFIAKSEVANWPVLGALAKMQNTLFFERKGVRIKEQLQVMASHFNQKGNLILFPEGTSTEGEHVEPFKSSLLQSVEMADADVIIQPVTLAYTQYENKPMNKIIRDHYAWYADMPFAPHFFSALGLTPAPKALIKKAFVCFTFSALCRILIIP